MYSEKIKYIPVGDEEEENAHKNEIRNEYFKNKNCLANVLDFLKQDIVIMRGDYFSYGDPHQFYQEDGYLDYDLDDDDDTSNEQSDILENINDNVGYHICHLNDHITIVDILKRCIFTNKDMDEGNIIGTILWVKNLEELLGKFADRNLKRVSNAIVQPFLKPSDLNESEDEQLNNESEMEKYLDFDFLKSMEVYQPEIIYEYTIDSHKENIYLDLYKKLVNKNLSSSVDKYIPNYKWCKGGKAEGKDETSTNICKCGGLRALCSLDNI
jgi:hypothetical protein